MPASILILSLLCMITMSCSRNQDPTLTELRQQCSSLMGAADKGSLDSLASEMLRISREEGNPTMEGFAHFFLSHYEPDLDDSTKSQRLHHLRLATEMAESTANDTLLCRVYNQNGVWELLDLRNISTSQYWFSKSIAAASQLNNRSFGIPAEVNLSETYRFDNDTLGIKYDLDLFRYASETDDPLLKFSAAMHCATHYSTTVNDTAELRPYIDALTAVDDQFPGTADYIYARHFFATGDYEKAEHFINLSHPENFLDYQILHAKILHSQRRFEDAESVIQKIATHTSLLTPSVIKDFFGLAAANAMDLGDSDRAYNIMKRLYAFADSVAKERSTEKTRRYRIEYEVLNKDKEISEQKLRYRNLIVTGCAAAIIVAGVAIAITFWIRRRNGMYRDIVRRNRDFIERQRQLNDRLAARDEQIASLEKKMEDLQSSITGETHSEENRTSTLPSPSENDETTSPSKIPEERINSIFERIQHFANDKQVWRDVSITRENFASLIGCNRTYFSEVLKIKTGMSYSQYMNSCRVNEAIRILSDPSDETPLKALSESLGFLSINTFYTAFRQVTGMSPDRYRKTAKEI